MAAVPAKKTQVSDSVKQASFAWEGRDKSGRVMKGEMRASGEAMVAAVLRRQGISVSKVKKQSRSSGGRVTDKDITFFTRQLATMLRSGVPLLQAFDIVAKGAGNMALARLLLDIRADIETGSSLNQAFRKYPLLFDALYCNLVAAGEAAGILDSLLDRLAVYKEKTLALKSQIKKALFYPISILAVAVIVTGIIMIFVVPQFKTLFSSFGAELPYPTLVVIAISDFFVAYWWIVLGIGGGGSYAFLYFWKRSTKVQLFMDRFILLFPIIGPLMHKAAVARWARTLSTMFAAGVPLVESLDSVAGAAGNIVFYTATKQIQSDVSTGTSLSVAMQGPQFRRETLFNNMVLQMCAIGEESGSLDGMLSKVADFYEQEVDDAVAALSSLMEPLIMAFLGIVIGGLVVAMYMPIFKMGSVV